MEDRTATQTQPFASTRVPRGPYQSGNPNRMHNTISSIPGWTATLSDNTNNNSSTVNFGSAPTKSNSTSSFDFTSHVELEKRDIQTGDLLFFCGEDYQSKIIEMGTASQWSHVGTAVNLFDTTITTLQNFMKYMPQNWRTIAEELSKITIMTVRMSEQGSGGGSPFSGQKEGSSEVFGSESIIKHISEIMIVHMLLRNNKNIKVAVQQECQYLEGILRLRHGLPSTATFMRSGSLNQQSSSVVTPRGEGSFVNRGGGGAYNGITDDMLLKAEEEKLLVGKSRYMCLWESTTSTCPSATCLLTGRTEAGVKLTNLDNRAAGYDGVVGCRPLKISTHLDPIIAAATAARQSKQQNEHVTVKTKTSKGKEKETKRQSNWGAGCYVANFNLGEGDEDNSDDDYTKKNASAKVVKEGESEDVRLFYQNQLYALFCNMVVNAGKPYERDYSEMLDAWAHSGFCCFDPSNPAPCRAFGWCMFKLLCCDYCPTCCHCSCCNCSSGKAKRKAASMSSSPDNTDRFGANYHPINEYASLYCSELTMQLLYDYLIIMELKNYEQSVIINQSGESYSTSIGGSNGGRTARNQETTFDDSPQSPRGGIFTPRRFGELQHFDTSSRIQLQNVYSTASMDPSMVTLSHNISPVDTPRDKQGNMISHTIIGDSEYLIRPPATTTPTTTTLRMKRSVLMCHPYAAQDADTNLNPTAASSASGTNTSLSQLNGTSKKTGGQSCYYHSNKDWINSKLNPFKLVARQVSVETGASDHNSVDVVKLCHSYMEAELNSLATQQFSFRTARSEEGEVETKVEEERERTYSLLGRTEVTPKYLALGELPVPFKINDLIIYDKIYAVYYGVV